MADVAAAFSDAGFTDVKTILASGNVLFDSTAEGRLGTHESRTRTAGHIRLRRLGTCLRPRRDPQISAAFPFEREVDGHHSYVTFVTDADVLDELAALAKDAGPDEKIERGEGVVYWQVPKTGTLDTTIGKTMGKKRYKSSTTTRNLRTVDKLLRP